MITVKQIPEMRFQRNRQPKNHKRYIESKKKNDSINGFKSEIKNMTLFFLEESLIEDTMTIVV